MITKKILAPREIELMHLYVTGISTKEIAHKMNISFYTFRAYLNYIHNKTKTTNSRELMNWWFENKESLGD
jgi:DNA-binding CsgD family transcriptional regulator